MAWSNTRSRRVRAAGQRSNGAFGSIPSIAAGILDPALLVLALPAPRCAGLRQLASWSEQWLS
jgi:hypothetical protein